MLSRRIQETVGRLGVQSTERIHVIVKVRSLSSVAIADLERRGLKVEDRIEPLFFISGTVTVSNIKNLSQSEYVSELHYDEAIHSRVNGLSLQSDSVYPIEVTPSVIGERLNVQQAYFSGIYGQGVTIAEIDSGVDSSHPMIQDAVISQIGNPDKLGHGTHVAGIAVGRRVNSPIGDLYGIAPHAQLVSYNGLPDGSGRLIDSMKGIQALLPYKPDIIMMSFGRDYDCGDTCPLCQMIDHYSKDHIFSIANGNFGPQSRTVGCPSTSRGGIAVGSIDFQNYVSSFSSRGPTIDGRIKPDIVEYGGGDNQYVYSATTGSYDGDHTGYTGLRGTSMAQPFHAGIQALLLSGSGSPKSVTEVIRILSGGSSRIKSDDFGWGLFSYNSLYKPKVK